MFRRCMVLLACLCPMVICLPAMGSAEGIAVEEIAVSEPDPEPTLGIEPEPDPEPDPEPELDIEPELDAEPDPEPEEETEIIVVEEVFIEENEPHADNAQSEPAQENDAPALQMGEADALAYEVEEAALYQHDGLSLWRSMLSTTVMQEFGEGNLPQSAHNYAPNTDIVYHYAADKAAAIRLVFDSRTDFESGWDGLIFYDADGKYIESKSGSELAGATYTVPGNGLYMRFVSNASSSSWGFAVTAMECVDQTRITSLSSDGKGGVTIKWKNYSGINGYQLQRAVINPSTGKAGTYTTLAQGTGKSQYKDTTAKVNTLYSYRVRIYSTTGSTKNYAKFDTQKLYNFKTTAIIGTGAVTKDTGAAIKLKWNAVSGAKYYEILRSTSSSGTYTVVGTAKDTSYTDYPPEKSTYYYKVKPYVSYKGVIYTTYASAAKALGYPKAPSGVFVRGSAAKTVNLTWNKVSNVKGYILYRSTQENSGYKKVTSLTTNKYTDTNAFVRRVNYYKLRTYTVIDGKTVYSDYSAPVAVYPLAVPTKVTAKMSGSDVRVSWTAAANAQEYVICRSYTSDGACEEIGTTTGTSFTATGLDASKGTAYLHVHARRTDGAVTSTSGASTTAKVQMDTKTLRALYIIEANFAYANDISYAYDKDMAQLNEIMSKGTPEDLPLAEQYAYKNQTKAQILQRIKKMASLADANDTTFFYLFTHGVKPTSGGKYWLSTSDGAFITSAELAAALKEIPGRVIVGLSCCYSGAVIGKGATAFEEEAMDAGQSIIDAFAAADEEITWMESGAGTDGENAKVGELCVSNKFFVFTSSSGTEYSWTDSRGGSYLLQWMNDGLYGADTNGDKAVTMKEMEKYLAERGKNFPIKDALTGRTVYMTPQVYPSASNYVIFQ